MHEQIWCTHWLEEVPVWCMPIGYVNLCVSSLECPKYANAKYIPLLGDRVGPIYPCSIGLKLGSLLCGSIMHILVDLKF